MSDEPLRVNPEVERNEDGTITVCTTDHGTLRLACPDWCRNVHSYPHGVARTDISHNGEPVWALAHTQEYGETGHVEVFLAQWPFSLRSEAVLCIEAEDGHVELGPPGARKVAQALRKHATTIDMLATQLEAIREASR